MAGKSTILTPALQEQFCQYARLGMPLRKCGIAVGISHTTWERWRKKGEQYEAEKDPRKKDRLYKYHRFAVELEQARTQGCMKHLMTVVQAAGEKRNSDEDDRGKLGTPEAVEQSKWLLRYAYPDVLGAGFHRNGSVEVTTETTPGGETKVTTSVIVMPPLEDEGES